MKLTRRKTQLGVGGAIVSPLAKRYVNQVLDSGRLTYGPFLRAFEAKFAKFHNRRFAIAMNSGTSALQVAVHALKELSGWRDGDEVLVPALTFIATSNVVLQNGLRPVFVDIDPKTYHIDPAKIESKITKRTRAIMPVHVFGVSAEMKPILAIAKRYKLRVIEDSCEAVCVQHHGEPVGSQGDIACFSTYQAHTFTTGVGGLLTANDPKIAVKARSLANHGRDSIYMAMDDDRGKRGRALREIIDRRFSFVTVGYSYRLTEFEGALGLAQLMEWEKNLEARQWNAEHLIRGLKPFERFLQLPSWPPHSEHGFMMFPIVIQSYRVTKADITQWLEDWNIETRDMLPLLNQPVYRKLFGNLEPKYPVATRVRKNGFYIGCHPEITRKDLDYVLAVFREFFARRRLAPLA
jgi:perosamine synthetase